MIFDGLGRLSFDSHAAFHPHGDPDADPYQGNGHQDGG
jgi:hypothetical protein